MKKTISIVEKNIKGKEYNSKGQLIFKGNKILYFKK